MIVRACDQLQGECESLCPTNRMIEWVRVVWFSFYTGNVDISNL